MNAETISGLLGGIGLFLLGMFLMTNGLRTATGKALQRILERWTHTTLRGIFAGFIITALVQSSSAVTVATLGFVNAGLMRLKQAVTVVYGSNIGTTMTAWLVALVGFNVDIKAFALPAIGIGMLLKLLWDNHRLGAIGEAIAGFGIFFLAIEILKGSFEGIGASIQFQDISPTGSGLILLVGAGFLMTLLMQSSSAAMALILTAAGGDVIPIPGAAAMIIGANVGTTTTAMLVVIGATSNAKRLATAHLFFNLITGCVALILLPWMLQLIQILQTDSSLSNAGPATFLAIFHTLFNVLGVAIMWPLTTKMVELLKRRFRSADEDEAKPVHLDNTLLDTAELAVKALDLELSRVGEISRRMAKGAISAELGPGARLHADRITVERLVVAAGAYVTDIQKASLSDELSDALPNSLRVGRYYNTAARLAERVAERQAKINLNRSPELEKEIIQFKSDVVDLIETADPNAEGYIRGQSEKTLQNMEQQFRELNNKLLIACTKDDISPHDMVALLELLNNIRRLGKQLEKGARYLDNFRDQAPAELIEEQDLHHVE